ncbi:MAG: acylphosphatase [Alcanivoracaceae bacterium]|nr:acylphosphatase [Alcanivoracaceae bacterium]MCG8393219.1 acylphosphatase [Pseudomonadales bacterium]|tara:strand:- start:6910 stop:7176 length:267 start_codon:yes stop_codon:yes gene_type:complete
MNKHVLVSGVVQGVGYRAWTQREATRRGLTGWVRNLEDGRVEALLQGRDDEVSDMLDAMYQGPAMAQVSAVEARDSDALPSNHFEVSG